MQELRANTAVDVLIGPFMDDADGDTPITGSTLVVELSKNGQGLATKTDATDPVHDAGGSVDGYYNCELDATDTNTEGTLTLVVHHADSLPIRHDYMVLAEAAWDSKYTAKDTGLMDVHVKTVEAGIIANASFNADVGSTAHGTNIIALAVRKILEELNLDHLLKVDTTVAADGDLEAYVVAGTIIAHLLSTSADATLYKASTDSMQAIRDWVGDGTNLAEAGGDGDHLTAINLPNQTMDITGDITGNLSGTTGEVASVAGDVKGNVDGSVATCPAATVSAIDNIDFGATMKASINTEVDSALDTAIPAAPTADSINQYIHQLKWVLTNLMVITEATGNVVGYKDDDVSAAYTVAAAFASAAGVTTRKRLE